MSANARSALFRGLRLRTVELANRIVISPMQQYAAGADGRATEYHYVHLSRLALGGAGLVFTEAKAVEPHGRLTYSDLGAWSDEQIEPMRRLVEGIHDHGSIAGAQILHAGRKASVQRPWDGFEPMSEHDVAQRGEHPWPLVGPSPIPANPGWPVPRELTADEIAGIVERHAAAARRCREAGFDVLGVHGAHGYLIHSFLSPVSNERNDDYGGDLERRMRFALEVAAAVRSEWPAERPLFYRLSCVDDEAHGWNLDQTVVLARALIERGVDVIDCSSRGLGRRTTPAIVPRPDGFQVPYSEHVRAQIGATTMTVGLIMDPHFAEAIVRDGRADLVAVGREALHNPQWPLHAALALEGDDAYERLWPPAAGWWLYRRAKALAVRDRDS